MEESDEKRYYDGNKIILYVIFFILFIFFAENLYQHGTAQQIPTNVFLTNHLNASIKTVTTNDYFIKGLYETFNLSNDKEVFAYVFSQLDDEATVFPTENYYYFKFVAAGKKFGGTFSL